METIQLRPLTINDAHYYKWFNDKEVTAGNSHGVRFMTLEDCMDYIRTTKDYVMGIWVATGHPEYFDIHIGNIALQNINTTYRSADLSIIIGEKSYWGRGYGKASCEHMINHAFQAMNLHRIALGTFHTNKGMIALALSLGFKQEGLRRYAAWKDGGYVHVIEYGLLREEWLRENHSYN